MSFSKSKPKVPQVQRMRSSHVMETTKSGRPFVKVCFLFLLIQYEKTRKNGLNYILDLIIF